MVETRKGMLLVISGPSGAGKGTLASLLLARDPSFRFSVSAATRAPRPGEIDGVHYHFMDEETFAKLIAEDAFVEYAEVHGNHYGTLKSEVFQRLENGDNVLLDIDTQGAEQVIASGMETVSVFVLPPSFTELRNRLEKRGTEKPEEIERRMRNARSEVERMDRYDYVVVNDGTPEESFERLWTIVQAEKLRTVRYQPKLED